MYSASPESISYRTNIYETNEETGEKTRIAMLIDYIDLENIIKPEKDIDFLGQPINTQKILEINSFVDSLNSKELLFNEIKTFQDIPS